MVLELSWGGQIYIIIPIIFMDLPLLPFTEGAPVARFCCSLAGTGMNQEFTPDELFIIKSHQDSPVNTPISVVQQQEHFVF